jgi:Ran GTPase-activating protein (RanGAP) involved in mRNA processing and transport
MHPSELLSAPEFLGLSGKLQSLPRDYAYPPQLITQLQTGRFSTVDLSKNGLNCLSLAPLTQVLSECQMVHCDLGDNSLNDNSAYFIEQLLRNPSLRRLDVRSNLIGGKTIGAIAANLGNLQELMLSDNNLRTPDLMPLFQAMAQNRSLTLLDLSGNLLSVGSLAAISEMLRINQTLVTLRLSKNKDPEQQRYFTIKPIFDALTNNRSLRCLDLSQISISHEDLKQLTDIATGKPGLVIITSGAIGNAKDLSKRHSLFDPRSVSSAAAGAFGQAQLIPDEKTTAVMEVETQTPQKIAQQLFPPPSHR